MMEAAPTLGEASRDLEPSPHDETDEQDFAREIWLLRLGLWAAVALVFAALALPLTSTLRFAVGAVALGPLMWIPSRLSQRASEGQENAQARARRFLRLRSATDVMLDEVRRLNGLTVDAHRGVRDPEETEREVAAIEARLHGLVDALRDAAGIEGRASTTLKADPGP